MRRLLILLLIAFPVGAATTPVFVQCQAQYFGNPPAGVGGTLTFNQPVSAGDGIMVWVEYSSGSATTATPTDVQSDTFTQETGYPVAGGGNYSKFTKYFVKNAIGGSTAVTVKLDVQDFFQFAVCEVAVQNRTTMIDKDATATGVSTSQSSGSATTTQADLIFGNEAASNDVITPTGGFTTQVSMATTNGIVATLTQSSAGSIAFTSTTTGGHGWVADLTAIAPNTTTALSSIAITPANSSAGAGIDVQLTATGTYADTSTANLSSICTWSLSNSANASITSTGVITGIRASSETVTCTLGAISGSTGFTITSSTPYTSDDFLGFINTPTNCSGNPLSQSFTNGSQSGNTQTVTVTDGTKFALNEAIIINGTSTAMDWIFQIKTAQAGMSYVTNISGNVITLSSPRSATVTGPVSGTFTDGHVYRQLVGSRWELCTPENHWIEAQMVAAADLRNVTAKYGGDNCAAEKYEMLRLVALNFSGTAEDSNEVYDPTKSLGGACPANRNFLSIPQNSDQNTTVYSSNNTFGYLDQPIKNIDNGTTSNYPGCPYHLSSSALIDYQDGRWTTFSSQNAINAGGLAAVYRSPWIYSMGMFDDTDGVVGVGAGPTFSTVINPGAQNCNAAWIVMNSSPIQAGNNFELYPSTGGYSEYIYPDPIIYSKVKAASTPTQCDVTHLCSLRDYFEVLYSGSISALNTAEGTGGKYDTFDSDGVCVGWNFAAGIAPSLCKTGNGSTAFTIGTGDGSTLTFSNTLHTNVDKHSVGIFQGGTMVGFDCPVEVNNCGSGSAGTGLLVGIPFASAVSISTIVGNGTTATVTCTSACGVVSGTQVAIDGNAVGGFNVLTTATSGSGTSFTFASSVNATSSGGPFPRVTTIKFLGSITYSTGAVSLTYSTGQAPANTIAITANYIHDGFGYCSVLTNCGVMDQDGVSTAWQGTNGVCLTENPCAGGDRSAANANATFGADLDGYVKEFWGSYFKAVGNAIHTTYPGTLYWGIDNVGSFCSPPNKGVLQAANQYVDVLFQIGYCETVDDNTSLSKYDFMTQYYDGPMVQFTVYTSSQSDNGCGGNVPCYSTQAARGIAAYHTQSDFINTLGHNGHYGQAGWVHWATHNFQSSGFGIFTNNKDNAYDGIEDVVASVTCSLAGPLSSSNCGGESGAANFLGSNGLTGTQSYKTGNCLWFGCGGTTFTVTVQSTNPLSGCTFTNTPDNGSVAGGTSTYVLTYNSGASLSVNAPASCGGNNFTSWTGCPSPSGLTCNISSIGANQVVIANYVIPGAPGCIVLPGSYLGVGSFICTDLTVNYSSPTNKLTFTYSTPNTLNISVAASQPAPSPFPISGGCTTGRSPRNKVWNCQYTVLSATQKNCNCQ